MPKYPNLLLQEPNNPLHLRKDDEKEQEEQRRKKKDSGRIIKFGIPMANDTLVSSSLCSLIFSRMKPMKEEKLINYGL